MSRIRGLRKSCGLSISQLSHQTGVNASALSWIELRKVVASPAVREAISRFFDEKEEGLFRKNGLAI